MDPLARLQALLERVLPLGPRRVKLQPAIAGGAPGEARVWVSEKTGWAMVNLHLIFFMPEKDGEMRIEDVLEQEIHFAPMSALASPALDEFVLAWGEAVHERLAAPCPRRFMPDGLGPADPHALMRPLTDAKDLRRAVAVRGVKPYDG